jgi:hypothetical protein
LAIFGHALCPEAVSLIASSATSGGLNEARATSGEGSTYNAAIALTSTNNSSRTRRSTTSNALGIQGFLIDKEIVNFFNPNVFIAGFPVMPSVIQCVPYGHLSYGASSVVP